MDENKKIINTLLCDYRQTPEYAEVFNRYFDNNESIQKALDTFVRPIEDFDKNCEAEMSLIETLVAMEEFGFELGYKFAMKLIIAGTAKMTSQIATPSEDKVNS